VLAVDVEPDARLIEPGMPSSWTGWEALFAYLSESRSSIEQATGRPAHFSWFLRMDPQIAEVHGDPAWAAHQYRKLLGQCEARGDEIGLHPHAYRWDRAGRSWIVEHGNQHWVDHCTRMAFEAYRGVYGRGCASFRFGDHWMSDRTLALAEELGAQFDLTLEPGQPPAPAMVAGERYSGSLPDYRRVPRRMYRPSRADYRREDARRQDGLLVIPISSGRKPRRSGRLGVLGRFARAEAVTLNLAIRPRTFADIVEQNLVDASPGCLVAVVRSDAAVSSPQADYLRRNLGCLLDHPLHERFQFATPQECAAVLRFDSTGTDLDAAG
jgi:hypothetical protein